MLRKAANILAAAFTAVLCLLAVLLVGVRVFGLTPYTIESGSMEPRYPVGSLIYVKKIDPDAVRAGQAITFVMNADGQTATHQVWRVDPAAGCFYTRGIANLDPNGQPVHDGAPVPFDRLIGRPVFCLPLVGYLAAWLTTAPGRCGIAALLLAALVFGLLPGAERGCTPAQSGQKIP